MLLPHKDGIQQQHRIYWVEEGGLLKNGGRGWFKGDKLTPKIPKQFVQAMRLFKEEPKWTPLNRSDELDTNPYRQEYVSQFLN